MMIFFMVFLVCKFKILDTKQVFPVTVKTEPQRVDTGRGMYFGAKGDRALAIAGGYLQGTHGRAPGIVGGQVDSAG